MNRNVTALGQPIYRRPGVPRLPGGEDLQRRVAAIVTERGPIVMSELSRALHFNADQETLHQAIANLRDAGMVAVRIERRHKTGRERIVVAPVVGAPSGRPA